MWISRIFRWVIAAFYAYGALVHIMNILGMAGFDWMAAPLKWQVLDVAYLLLDATVVIALPARSRLGYLALFTAAISQIVLYTTFRDWIVDVPEAFARSPEELAYLDLLVAFHAATLVIASPTIRYDRHRSRSGRGRGRPFAMDTPDPSS